MRRLPDGPWTAIPHHTGLLKLWIQPVPGLEKAFGHERLFPERLSFIAGRNTTMLASRRFLFIDRKSRPDKTHNSLRPPAAIYAPVAQWIEQWPPEPCVARSTRVRRTSFNPALPCSCRRSWPCTGPGLRPRSTGYNRRPARGPFRTRQGSP